MSGGLACRCDGTEEERRARWRVTHRRHNHSVFGGRPSTRQHSAWSEVVCARCRGRWRTKAAYVDELQGECGEVSS